MSVPNKKTRFIIERAQLLFDRMILTSPTIHNITHVMFTSSLQVIFAHCKDRVIRSITNKSNKMSVYITIKISMNTPCNIHKAKVNTKQLTAIVLQVVTTSVPCKHRFTFFDIVIMIGCTT